jgi:predicted DNA binding protein
MSTVVDVTIPTDKFALADTFTAVPDAEFETVRVAAHGPRGMMPFLWATSPRPRKLEQALKNDGTTEEVSRMSENNCRSLYRLKWRPSVRIVMNIFVQANGSLLTAKGYSDRWELRVVFPDRESVSRTFEKWQDHGITPSIRRINGVTNMVGSGGLELSPCQRETLVEAYEMDYYEIPRGISLDELADQLDVSHQALSERFRRGHRNLIETTLCNSPGLVTNEP